MQIGRVKKNLSLLPPGTKILMMPQLSYMPDQILRKKWKKKPPQISRQNLTFL